MLYISPASKIYISEIASFIDQVFSQHVAPQYSSEGVEEFAKYITPDALDQRLQSNHFMLIARDNDDVVGVIEIRDNNHVSMLFVKTDKQKQGIGRQLLTEAIKRIQENDKSIEKISVHSSPNAVEAYQKLGFTAIAPEKEVHGIKFVTMERALS